MFLVIFVELIMNCTFEIELEEYNLFQFVHDVKLLGDSFIYHNEICIEFNNKTNKWIVYGIMSFK
jgi:hypothetical protein